MSSRGRQSSGERDPAWTQLTPQSTRDAQIAPAADLLNAATTDLRTMPADLRQTFDEARETWAREMRRDQDAFIDTVRQVLDDQRALLDRTSQALQHWEHGRREAAEEQQAAWRESVELVQKGAAEIAAIVEALPAAFTREIEQIAGRLGRAFSIGAQQHVGDLTEALRKGNETLTERIETSMREVRNQLLNDTSRVVGESAEEVHRRVGEPLLSMLRRVTRGIEEALSTLPENAATFAASLSTADEKLQQSIDRLKAAADHLEKVVELNEGLHASLTRAFRDGAADSFEPVRKDLQDIADELRRAAELKTGARRGFWRRLFDRLRRREPGDGAAGGRQFGPQ